MLYQSLVNCEPVRDVIKVDYLFSDSDSDIEFNELIGESIWYGVETTLNIDAIFIKEELPAIMGINNATITCIEPSDKGCKLILGDDPNGGKRYISALLFKDMDELNEYKARIGDRVSSILNNAKSPEELL